MLATGSSFDFVQFFQILCWIVIPAFLITALVTVYLHYKKRKKETAIDEEEKLLSASPELVGYTKGDGEFVCFDHSPLISEYKKRLSFNHARYSALRHDFEKLEEKYAGLASYAVINFSNKNSIDMEYPYEQMPQQMQEEIQRVSDRYSQEKEELLARLQQMNQAYTSLEEENESLSEQLKLRSAGAEEEQSILSKWKEENSQLKEKVAEQEYIREVLQEKKLQIEFLQNQLEQRIKTNHLDEYQKKQLHTEINDLKNLHEEDVQKFEILTREFQQKKEETEKLQVILTGKEEQLAEKQELLASKLDHITLLENTLHESKEKYERQNEFVNESKGIIADLQEQLVNEQAKLQAAEQKYAAQRQTLQRLYNDISMIVEQENSQSPVIALRPEYVNREAEEIAVH
ncbi:hypothetical protein [Terrimonas alba]|uniref:hypothetical protein n=1 Tax=Terrimonas alba TaxID=3349636 RepID=UPI0035F4D55F